MSGGQLRAALVFSAIIWRYVAPSRYAIQIIVEWGTKAQMGWVYAAPHIAAMKHPFVRWYWAFVDFVGYPVRFLAALLAVIVDVAVAASVYTAQP